MRTVIIDDERYACEELAYMLEEMQIEVIGTFMNPQQGFDFVMSEQPDVVFLDIDIPKTSGIELALQIQSRLTDIVIVFVSAYSEYALDAYEAYPIDYILKPVQEVRLKKTILRIMESLNVQKESVAQDIYINLFGKYGAVRDHHAIKFQTKKTFELLAYLLCNADIHIQRNELVRMLFGEDSLSKGVNNLYVTMFRLRKDLVAAGVKKDQLLIREDYSVEIQDGICDFTDFYRFITKYKTIDHKNLSKATAIILTITGCLLSGMDAEWILEIREWVQIKVEELIMQTALYYSSTGQFEQVEELLYKLLDINPMSEASYHQLLDMYIDSGQFQKYSYYYDKYVYLMRNELNCIPEKKYVRMAEKIWQKESV